MSQGSNRFSSSSRSTTGKRSEHDDETAMYWVEFTAIFDQRRKKGNRSPTQMYNILSDEIGLSPGTLASFYHHRTKSRKTTTMNKIIPWIEREGKGVVSFASSNSSIINNEVSNS
ncbi:hypothetical protein RhiirC2_777223 [Rhizophagus irregularis]|uniref:Uncharacterized protein n=1 Tax=Rhizophagus irregularis TaxID=588596 RepID=A0A2N1NEX2_9GLOM|nr:hypothetical protein RhiirC2_777223 [Rhizophagus irregularis]